MKAIERLCLHCETPFLARNANAHLCSDLCREESRRANARNRHRERKNKKMVRPGQKMVRPGQMKQLHGATVAEEDAERNHFLFILLDVPSTQLTQFEQGVVWALTQTETTLNKKVSSMVARLTA